MWKRKKSSAAISRRPVRSFGDHAAVEKEKHHRHLGRGVGMAEAADDGAAVADRDVGDVGHGLADERIGRVHGVVQLELAMPRHRLDDDRAVLDRGCPVRPPMCWISTRRVGLASRRFIAGMRLWPPARIAAPGSAARSATASPTDLRSAVFEERRLHSLPFGASRFTARPETMRRMVTRAASFDPPKAVSRPHPPGEVITMTCPISIHIVDSVFQMTILIEFAPVNKSLVWRGRRHCSRAAA